MSEKNFEEFEDNDDDDDYEDNTIILENNLSESEIEQIDPVYTDYPISFCHFDNITNSSDELFSMWKYITYTYIDEDSRYYFPLFGPEYDMDSVAALTFYLN